MRKTFIVILGLLVISGLFARGYNSDGSVMQTPSSQKTFADDPERTLVNIGNWGYWQRDNGESAHTPGGNSGGLYPRGTAAAIYLDGVLVGGYQGGNLKVSGQIYRTGTEAGYIMNGEHITSAVDPSVRIFRIRKDYATLTAAQVRQDAAELYEKTVSQVTDADIQAVMDQYEKDWNEWPTDIGAPFYDLDGDGVYDPADGETPGIANADQVVWFVITDANQTTTNDLYGTDPIGIEQQMTLWAYNQPGASLGQIVFKQIRIINKGDGDLTDAYISLWSDPDVGAYSNDLIGVDTSLSMMYAYNGEATDGDYDGYGLAPPAAGYDFFAGPIVPSAGDTAIFNLQRKPGYKNLPASSFGYFSAGGDYSDPGPYGEVEAAREYYNLMRGYAPIDDLANPTPWEDENGNPTKFPFSGDPVGGTGHLDSNPGDRRMLINAGPFTLAEGDTQDVVTALVGGLGDTYLSSITDLKNTDAVAQTLFDDLFQSVPSAPPAPRLSATPLDNQVILDWGSDEEGAMATESAVIAGYSFQGYNVYQLPTATSGKSDAVLIATYDIVDGVQTVYGNVFLPEYGETVNVPVQYGLDKGVRRQMVIDYNHLTGGPLYTGSDYFFAVTAYNYNAAPDLIEDQALESPVTAVGVTLTPAPVGTEYAVEANAALDVSHVGPSQGIVSATVVNPDELTGNVYLVSFTDDTSWVHTNGDTLYGTYYTVTDSATSAALVPAYRQASSQSDLDQPIVDGIQLVVSGPELGIVDIAEYGATSGDLIDGTVDSHIHPSLSQTGLILDNRAGDVNLPAYARDYDRFDYWGMDDVIIDFSKQSYTWDYISEALHVDSVNSLPVYAPFAAYRVTFPEGDTIRLFAGFWDTNGDGAWTVNGADDWETPTFGAEAWEPIYCWQGYDASGNDISYDPANEAQYAADGDLSTSANTTWGGGTGEFHYPYITATFFGAYYGLNADGSTNGDPGGGVSALPIAGNYDKFGTQLTESHFFKFTTAKANSASDVFKFRAPSNMSSTAIAEADVDMINVYPNPYYAANSQETNRFDKFVTFTHLPQMATVRIFSLDGKIVRVLDKDDTSQYLRWDLRNHRDLPVASGAYIAHIDLDVDGQNLGQKVLKLFIVQPNQVVKYY